MIASMQDDMPLESRDAAVWWDARHSLQKMSRHDQALFSQWLTQPDNQAAWSEMQQLSDLLATHAAHADIRDMRERTLRDTGQNAGWWSPGRIAAAVALFAVAIAGAWSFQAFRPEAPAAVAVQSFSTKPGQRRDVMLPDGSRVILNTASLVRVAYSGNRRDLYLMSGQAFFKVAKDARRPFSVFAGGERVQAVGTQFDVEVAPAGGMRVLLVEGHIAVADQSSRSRSATDIAMRQPGQMLSIEADGRKTLDMIDIGRSISWTNGELIFRNDPVGTAVTQINRYSSIRVEVDAPDIAMLPVSGIFRTDRAEDFVDAMVALYPLRVEQVSSGVVRLVWKKGQGDRRMAAAT